MFSVRFAPIRPPQLHLTPINFEIPHTESPPMFIGREWLYREIEQVGPSIIHDSFKTACQLRSKKVFIPIIPLSFIFP